MKWDIDSVEIKGFKSINASKISLGNVNVIIGPNGSGKSNFLEVFRMLRGIVRKSPNELFIDVAGGVDRILHLGSKNTKEISVTLKGAKKSFNCVLTPERGHFLKIFSKVIVHEESPSVSPIESIDDHYLEKRGYPFNGQHEDVLQTLLGFRIYQFNDTSHSSPIRTRSARVSDNEYLRDDGNNLASFLYLLKKKYPKSFSEILRVIRWIAPFFEDFHLEPEALDNDFIRLRWRHVGMDEIFDVSDFSDGTLRFICLAVALLQPEEKLPGLLLFDEPELGLHPHAIELLVGLMQSVGDQGRTKIITSTQSVPFANQFSYEDVIVVDRVENAASFRRLTREETESWLDEFRPGDAWMRNYFGGNP